MHHLLPIDILDIVELAAIGFFSLPIMALYLAFGIKKACEIVRDRWGL